MSHTVKLDQFEGPFDLLLQLIEQEELDVTAIALASVCEEYLAQLKRVEHRAPEELADFLVIAAKLLYLKSLALVPGAEAPVEDTTGLADQLRIYRAFLHASRELERRWTSGVTLYAAERMPIAQPTFLPPPRLTGDTLHATFARIIADLEPIVRIPRAVIGRVISIDDRIAEIRQLITQHPHASFADVLRGRTSRADAIVSFLALLELVKQRVIEVKQDERFAPMTIARLVH
ncbi:segregation/condensation protein A [Candidatus Uhrbacteria bacterium]|nr:segregation/condensation protein A [Candidatus Uhrbacteria bacterium]